ncbi:N-6 DNA methylase [Helicobacter suis]|uniref:N-6 DNA methylase n=1 Tax=Helicobacter suis TaxID=104628 RepID=UPI0013D56944|nr:N-6 DNA methylase [Helicobacter suis]
MFEEIFKHSSLDFFKPDLITDLKKRVEQSKKKGYITCLVRDKAIKLTPEEVVRQLYLAKLIEEYHYPKECIQLEYPIYFGREVKRADIVVLDQEKAPYIIVELKKPREKEGIAQLKSYAHASGVPLAVWNNGEYEIILHRRNPNHFINISHLPHYNQSLKEVLSEQFKYVDLLKKDVLSQGGLNLKSRILLIEDEVLAGAGVDAFEEVFKLIFIKLYDELNTYRKDKKLINDYHNALEYDDNDKANELYKKMHNLEFRNYEGIGNQDFKDRLERLFTESKEKWPGIFAKDSSIALTPSHLEVCVSVLQECKFFNSNLEVIDEAFEYLVSKDYKGEKGQYFTPRYVIDMCVKMLNPKSHESMIDPAAGSCGFPIHTAFYVWREIYNNLDEQEMLSAEEKNPEALDYVKRRVFAIDFDSKAVRVARALNIIAGDGHTNVFKLNALDFPKYNDAYKVDDVSEEFNRNFKDLLQYKKDSKSKDYRYFSFDIVMANPPFAGNVKESYLKNYELRHTINFEKTERSENARILKDPSFDACLEDPQALVQTKEGYKKIKIKEQKEVSRDVLFIERNLDLLKPGGRMAIVLPQGRFNNASDQYIREFIAHRARILAVVGLHPNVFKPHTGTKTSVLFLQKWDEKLCPYQEDYNIFFATMQEPSKDNSGDKIYVKQERVKIQITLDHQITTQELSLEDFYTKYPSLEAANFIEFEGYKITDEAYKNLTESQQKQACNQKATLYTIPLLDKHGHLVVKHDLFSHEGLTKEGIAEAFIDFAKSEGLSFWQ